MKVAYVIHDSKYGEAERKFLHYIVDSVRFAQVVVLLLQPNKITDDLDRLKIPHKQVKGLNGASTYLRFNPVNIVNVLGSSKIANNIANFVKRIKVVETHFTASKDLLDSDRLMIVEKPLGAHKNAVVAGLRLSPILLASVTDKNRVVFATRALDQFNLLIPAKLAECFLLHKDSVEVAIYSPNPETVSSKLKALTTAKITSLSIDSFVCSNTFVDCQRNSEIAISAYESLVTSNIIIPNTSPLDLLKSTSKEVRSYDPAGSIELLRFYCLEKKEQSTPLSEEIQFGKFLEETYNSLFKEKKTSPEVKVAPQEVQPPIELCPLLSKDEKTYIIVPYSIYGGAEVYLSNYLEGQDPSLVSLIFLANNIPMQRKWQATFECISTSLADLPATLIKRKASRIIFYNSRSVYQILSKIKQSNKQMRILEIIHSYLHWQDSMHGVLRTSVDHTFVVANTVAKQWGIARYEVLPPKINVKKFKIPKRTTANRVTIGTVARISPEKNLFKILDIATYLSDNYHFVIVGQDGGSKKDLLKQIRAKGLSNRVTFREYTSEVEKEYATFDLFLLTSNIEGTPLTILEAQAAELPIVAPNVGAIEEMLAEYDKSFVYDKKVTPQEIASRIKGLTNAPTPTFTIQKRDPDSREKHLNVLYIQKHTCIRAVKQALSLKGLGHKVHLLCAAPPSSFYKVSDRQIFESVNVIPLKSFSNASLKTAAVNLIATYGIDVIHCHNEPDLPTTIVNSLSIPVIHDTHDAISMILKDRGTIDNKASPYIKHEESANAHSTARIYISKDQQDYILDKYPSVPKKNNLIVPNCFLSSWEASPVQEKLSAKDGKLHIVYVGGIVLDQTHSYYIYDVAKNITNQGIHFHIYPSVASEVIKKKYKDISPLVHIHESSSPSTLATEISKYDYGSCFFNERIPDSKVLECGLPNKFFDYMNAKLPVLASPGTATLSRLIEESGSGIICSLSQVSEKAVLPAILSDKAYAFVKELYAYETYAVNIIQLYKDVLK